MTRTTLPLLAASLGLFAACAAPGTTTGIEIPTKLVTSELLKQTLASEIAPNADAIISYVELPPHGIVPPHWHPGEDFPYMIEGSGTLLFKDGSSLECKIGQAAHVPLKKIHWFKAGPQGAKALVFRVHPKGKAIRYAAEK